MANAAILVGNVNYKTLARLDCCAADVEAIRELLDATGKYDSTTLIVDETADDLKLKLREAIDKITEPDELFFYFTGHGHQSISDFFYCSTNFDDRRPNETGLSTSELHTLLRLADAKLVVKVIDACNSGTALVKSDGGWIPQNKEGFRNIIQISSCLDSQNSLTGDPLSLFTDKFRSAALRKKDGPVFYTDIISTLRDDFMENNSQTPFFVSQHTGREQFVDDACKLERLRDRLDRQRPTTTDLDDANQIETQKPLTLLERLTLADSKVANPTVIENFTSRFFNKLLTQIKTSDFSDFFSSETVEHPNFYEPTSEKFIIRVMSNEPRTDNFVTASHSKHLRTGKNSLFSGALLAAANLYGDDAFEETWDLRLNCAMTRAQVKITLTPKFINLKRIVLVVSCAPSLDHCYIFEIATEHSLQDFGKFDPSGPEISRRWWKLGWTKNSDGIVEQISGKLKDGVRTHLENAEKRLSPE